MVPQHLKAKAHRLKAVVSTPLRTMNEALEIFNRENPPLPQATPEQQMHAVRRQIQSGNRVSWRDILLSQGLSPIEDEVRIAPELKITTEETKDKETTLRVSGFGVTRPPTTKINLTGE